MSDQKRISPHDVNTISSRQVMRFKKNIFSQILLTNIRRIVWLTAKITTNEYERFKAQSLVVVNRYTTT